MVMLVRETSRTVAIATALLCLLSGFNCLNGVAGAGKVDDSKGPVFLKEPTNRIDFSNSTGAVVECSATGNPPPEMIWIRSDGTAVGDVPGLRQILPNGNLVFPPFRAEDYRQEVHAQVYACMAKNQFGSVISRDVNVRAVINQHYGADILMEYVIRGNSAILKCSIPSFVSDFVRVEAWIDEENNELVHSENYVVNQYYVTEAENEYIIRGNSAILKCKIPSFIADFHYQIRVNDEFVLNGNAAILKCLVPSFLQDFITIESWDIDDQTVMIDADESTNVVHQYYQTRLTDEFVLNGNAAILKCLIPSYISDFVFVDAWLTDEGEEYLPVTDGGFVIHQFYNTRVIDEYVLNGNAGILKCLIPSFVSDFISVTGWLADDGTEIEMDDSTVVNQYYEAQVYDVFVIRGNTALFKCQIPSFVADHVEIIEWTATDGTSFKKDETFAVVAMVDVNIYPLPTNGTKQHFKKAVQLVELQ
uniref:Ig-like domain-containing protein n=1 Tax=Anopheles coluzzii TaxID=1518534 RepID=A0A8W7P936_ANOCL